MPRDIDTFIKLIQQVRQNAIEEDDDPNNILLQTYTNPYDQVNISDSFRVMTSSVASLVWGNGSTFTAYDSNGQPYQYPSCGWSWGSNGRWNGTQNFILPWQLR